MIGPTDFHVVLVMKFFCRRWKLCVWSWRYERHGRGHWWMSSIGQWRKNKATVSSYFRLFTYLFCKHICEERSIKTLCLMTKIPVTMVLLLHLMFVLKMSSEIAAYY